MTSPNLAQSQNVFAMTPVVKTLVSGENTIYTVPIGKTARLDKLVLTNTGEFEVIVSVSLVPQGSTAARGTRVGPTDFPLAPGDALTVEEATTRWVPSGVTLSVTSSAGDSVNAVLTGLEFA